jgi:tRNA dimethylallyltransferase
LLCELKQRDPATFSRIDQKNPRRVIRAVEVIRLTGRAFSEQRSDWGHATRNTQPAARNEERILALTREPKYLHARINARVDKMFAAGLVDETRRLLERGLEQNQSAMQAIGYRQVVEHLRGERSLPETIELVKIKTRQFAKRQMTWFRRQLNMEWSELKPEDSLEKIVRRLIVG